MGERQGGERQGGRERARERQRQRQRHRHRQRHRETERQRDRDTERHRETERDVHEVESPCKLSQVESWLEKFSALRLIYRQGGSERERGDLQRGNKGSTVQRRSAAAPRGEAGREGRGRARAERSNSSSEREARPPAPRPSRQCPAAHWAVLAVELYLVPCRKLHGHADRETGGEAASRCCPLAPRGLGALRPAGSARPPLAVRAGACRLFTRAPSCPNAPTSPAPALPLLALLPSLLLPLPLPLSLALLLLLLLLALSLASCCFFSYPGLVLNGKLDPQFWGGLRPASGALRSRWLHS